MRRSFTALSLIALAAALAQPAAAQTQVDTAAPDDPTTQTSAADDVPPGDIIVTAQRREERLQDVPVAVSVISGDAIAAQGGINLENAQYLVPSLNFRKSGTSINQSLYIRGVGTTTFSIAGEPSISTVVDGVVFSRAGEAFSDLVDIERIEVLRGPQGTLFGKNASAGVVNIVTRRPERDFGGSFEGGVFFGEGEEYRGRGTLNVPLGENVRTRFTGFYSDYQGNIFNETVGRRVNGYKRYGVRGVLEFDVSDAVTATLIGDWRKAEDDCCGEVIGGPPLLATGAVNTANLATISTLLPPLRGDRTRRLRQNLVTATIEKSFGVSLQVDAQIEDGPTLTSITAYRNYDNREIRDGDFLDRAYVGFVQLHDDGPQFGDTISQEFRLTSPGNEVLDYVVGLYYSRADSERTFTRNDIVCNTPALNPPNPTLPCGSPGAPPSIFPSGTANFGSVFTNVAAFGQATYDITEDLHLTAGLRYTVDDLGVFHIRRTTLAGPGINPNFDAGVFNNGATTTNAAGQTVFVAGPSNGIPYRASTDATNLSGRASLSYDFSDDVTAYATYARGYKGPAFNTFFNLTTPGAFPIEEETADSYEAGLKTSLMNGRLVVNLAGYYAKYKNYQANNPDFVAGVRTTRFTNAGTISTKGAELDLLWRPTSNISISGGAAYTDAQVDRFRVPPGGNAADTIAPGTPLAYAPKFKGSLNGEWRVETGSGFDILLGAQGSYQTKQLSLFVANPIIRRAATIPSYGLLDASIALVDANDRYKLTFVAKNLLDESFAAAITDGGPGGSYRYLIPREADRYYGVTARVNF